MPVSISLESMTVEEKVRTMELIWDNLCRRPEEVTFAQWHGDVLKEREKVLAAGAEGYMDWEEAKRQLDKETG